MTQPQDTAKRRSKRPNVKRVCEQCQVAFFAKASDIDRGGGRYCSLVCQRLHKANPPENRVCRQCGAPFIADASKVASGQGLFCSVGCARFSKREPIEVRFWRYVNKTDSCWLWTGSTVRFGYGQLQDKPGVGHAILAHRVSWELHNGPIPEGLKVLHNCPDGDNPACVNPAHLFLGTQSVNIKDGYAKGRIRAIASVRPEVLPRGVAHHNAKFTEADIRSIRARYAAGESVGELARAFDVTHACIGSIVHRRSWRHVL